MLQTDTKDESLAFSSGSRNCSKWVKY